MRTITNLQKKIRKELKQRQLKQEHEYNAAVTIQSKVRTFEPRSRFLRTKKDTVVVQSLIRRRAAQRKLKQLKADAKSVNHLKEVSYKLENKVIELTQNLASKVKENKEMTERIKELQVQVEESAKLQETLENMKKEHLIDIDNQKSKDMELQKTIENNLQSTEQTLKDAQLELEDMVKQHDELKEESKKQLEELEQTKKTLVEYQTLNGDLQNEVKSLKEEIARLQTAMSLGTVTTSVLPQTPLKDVMGGGASNFNNMMLENSDLSPNDLNLKSRSTPLSGNNHIDSLSVDRENGVNATQINEELYRLLEDTEILNQEITEGLLKGFEVPDAGVAIQLSKRDVVYPARILIIVLSEMWRFGLTKQSESFLAQVLTTIQKLSLN